MQYDKTKKDYTNWFNDVQKNYSRYTQTSL
jgi:hypothetical protein